MRKLLFRITLAVSFAACALSLSTAFWADGRVGRRPVLAEAQQLYDGAHSRTRSRSCAMRSPPAASQVRTRSRPRSSWTLLVKAGSRVEAKEQFRTCCARTTAIASTP